LKVGRLSSELTVSAGSCASTGLPPDLSLAPPVAGYIPGHSPSLVASTNERSACSTASPTLLESISPPDRRTASVHPSGEPWLQARWLRPTRSVHEELGLTPAPPEQTLLSDDLSKPDFPSVRRREGSPYEAPPSNCSA
jgi:hypothetical protein